MLRGSKCRRVITRAPQPGLAKRNRRQEKSLHARLREPAAWHLSITSDEISPLCGDQRAVYLKMKFALHAVRA